MLEGKGDQSLRKSLLLSVRDGGAAPRMISRARTNSGEAGSPAGYEPAPATRVLD